MSMIPALISGQPWFGKIPTIQSTVLYLDWENPANYVAGNVQAQFSRDDWELYKENLIIPEKLPAYLSIEWLDIVYTKYQISGPLVLIVDSAYAAFGAKFAAKNSTWENNGSDV